MQFSFDLISDLHVDSWPLLDWDYRATSPYCILAGDISYNHSNLKKTLHHLTQHYQQIFYIDGNEEHKKSFDNLELSYHNLTNLVNAIPDVVHMHGNVIIVNGLAIIGVNGWWTFDFDALIDSDKSREYFEHVYQVDHTVTNKIVELAQSDALYLLSTVKKLQTYNDVKKIVIVTHTVPLLELVDHDIDLSNTDRMNYIGNKYLTLALNEDTEKKITTWCFGHYHGDIDQTIDGVRYVNNCRGRKNTKWGKEVYHPLRITIDV